MILTRTALLLAIVVMVLPADRSAQEKLQGLSGPAFNQAITFCDRNGGACDTAAQAWSVFKQKAQFGATLIADMATRYWGLDERPAPAQTLQAAPRPASKPSRLQAPRVPAGAVERGTLRDEDWIPQWRGPEPRTLVR